MKEVLVKSVPQKDIQKNVSPPKKTPVSQVKKVKNQQGLGKTQMFHFLTPVKRMKAVKLFKYIMKNKMFSLNNDGELIHNGNTLHDSNIVELITHAVQNVLSTPTGMKFFNKTLKKKNIPVKYISNKIGKKILNKSLLGDTLTWRPPGHLNKRHN